MSMELRQLHPWGEANLKLVSVKQITVFGVDYGYAKHRFETPPIAVSRVQRLSETEAAVYVDKDPDPTDATAPTLSATSANGTGPETAEGIVDTDEADGVLYWVLSQSSTAPTAEQLKAGNDQTGSPSAASGAKLMQVTGSQLIEAKGLTGGTTYYFHYLQKDEAENESDVTTSGSLTTS